MLRLTFLGTSAGVPTKQRNVTALAIECLNAYLSGEQPNNSSRQQNSQQGKKHRPWLLIDCGEGTQQQLLHTKLSLNQLAAICITHIHGDHCYGLPGLLASAAMSGRTAALTIIAPKAIAQLLDAVTLTTELTFPFVIDFIAIEEVLTQQAGRVAVNLEQLDHQQTLVIDITPLSHRVPSHAFGITQTIHHRALDTDKLKANGVPASPLWGKLQRGEDVITADGQPLQSIDYVNSQIHRTRIVVAGDNDTPDCLRAALKDADLLVHEATYTAEVLANILAKNADSGAVLDSAFDPMHSSAEQVGKFAQNSGLQNLILTHFSARYQSFDNPNSSTANMGHIRMEAQSVYHGNLWLAADFDQYLADGAADKRVQFLGSVSI